MLPATSLNTVPSRSDHRAIFLLPALLFVSAAAVPNAIAQETAQTPPVVQMDQDDSLRIRLPILIVTPQKEEEDVQAAPVSVTPVPKQTLDEAGIRSISEAADYAPNTHFNEFTARKLSNARFRGLGASPANPAVTTYIDGVPQLNTNSSSIELLDVGQIEFVRGPQSALFGRNTISGLVNVTTSRPSLREWSGSALAPIGNFGSADVRAAASGPIVTDRLGLGVAFGHSRREGFTTNTVTGNDLDFRAATFAKTQLLWTPAADWETRFIVTVERARDGDYTLNDLDALRANPYEVARDFEGHTDRDIVAPTVQLRHTSSIVDLWSTTGLVWWETDDLTDLDATALPLVVRNNNEKDFQFTQEVRLASARNSALVLSDIVSLRWQAGVSFFTQAYDQEATNDYAPFVLSQLVVFPVREHSPIASLNDRGVGVYGETTFSFHDRLDTTIGARGDFEHKEADLNTFFEPAIAAPVRLSPERDFSDVSPQFTVAYRAAAGKMVYGTVARGFKAGGFNPASPQGTEAYDEEHSWNYEGGAKTMWLSDRLAVNASVFYLRWRDMQVNSPNPFVPGQFFIENAAGATSKGVEVEFNARLAANCDVFGGLGVTNARFGDGSLSSGVVVDGNRLSNAPRYTADIGGQYSVALPRRTSAYVRAEVTFRGAYHYDDANTEEQEAYSLANFRAGIRGRLLFAEVWTRNAFDTRYIPVALAFPTASGFLGESGAPRTFGLRIGANF
jgi:iron complex outermembrane receptor protein